MKLFIRFLFCFCLITLCGCQDNPYDAAISTKPTIEKSIAIVLPMEKGLESHWKRCLSLYTSNLDRAYKSQDVKIKLNFEFYDENAVNLDSLSVALGRRDDIYAVVGGLYSSDASVLTSNLSRAGKTFFTLATSEELVRAYASTGYLWAMTETDITQCEVLLSRVVNFGGKSVALIAKEDDIYGKTFLDWFAFQAKELGLENKGVFRYRADNVSVVSKDAVACGAEYVICVPSEIDEIGPMVRANVENGSFTRLLFSDTGYGTDVLTLYGEKAEGLEGVAFGADPESGFDVSYSTFFGASPTTGEAQLYDAVMLIGYAAWYEYLHPESSLQQSLREVVSGEDISMGSWMAEDMSLVIDAIARGDSPYVRGASGPLRFDKKIFTNVLATTYYNYRIYDGRYIILDYNTSDGGNRTDATLAGWNWKASQMQEFDRDADFTYPAHEGNWALLVAASTGWSNYRHQADVLAIYQQLKKKGYTDDRIVLITEDDLARHPSNPEKDVIRVTPGGDNVYENIEVDYRLSQLSPDDFLDILSGIKSERLPEVISSDGNDNIFIFWSGHGVPGAMCWNDIDRGMTAEKLSKTLLEMNLSHSYRKLLMMVEACYSGGVMEKCEGIPGMLFVTAANGDETSKADIFSGDLRVWMSNRFTSTFIRQITENSAVSMRDLYYRLFINTVGSHVMVYNARNYGNLYSSDMSEFIDFKN